MFSSMGFGMNFGLARTKCNWKYLLSSANSQLSDYNHACHELRRCSVAKVTRIITRRENLKGQGQRRLVTIYIRP